MSLSKSGSRIDTPLYPEHSVKQMAVWFESGNLAYFCSRPVITLLVIMFKAYLHAISAPDIPQSTPESPRWLKSAHKVSAERTGSLVGQFLT